MQTRVVNGAFDEGMALREKRRLKAAVAAFERAVAEAPLDARAWFWLAATRDNRGLEAEAIPAYERALQLGLDDTEAPKAWIWLASSYSKTGRCAEALDALSHSDALGGYDPRDEFERIATAIRRRCRRAS